jgi:hypothetical protein
MAERSKRGLSVNEQYAYMRQICPGFRCKVQNGRLSCSGTLQPFSFTEKYAVRISYRVGESPKVYVDEPALERRQPSEPIPHTYPGDRPCLYFPPNESEWSSRKIIAQTIVPWLTLWLFYYETWLSTGRWQGGGEHPRAEDKDENAVEHAEQLSDQNRR